MTETGACGGLPRHTLPQMARLALAPLLLCAPSAHGWDFTITKASDLICTGGAT